MCAPLRASLSQPRLPSLSTRSHPNIPKVPFRSLHKRKEAPKYRLESVLIEKMNALLIGSPNTVFTTAKKFSQAVMKAKKNYEKFKPLDSQLLRDIKAKRRETFLLNKDQISKLVKEINILKRQQTESKKQLIESHHKIQQKMDLILEHVKKDNVLRTKA